MFSGDDAKKAVEAARQLIVSELRAHVKQGLAQPIVAESIGGSSPEFFYECVLLFATKQATK